MEAYQSIISNISSLMRSKGFIRKDLTFWKKHRGNWLVANIQNSQSNSVDEKKFTVNLGVCSEVIRLFQGFDIAKKPKEYECHLRMRIGELMNPHTDGWWSICNGSDSTTVGAEICHAISERGIPFLESNASDWDLISYWTVMVNASSGGVGPFEELTILMKTYGVSGLEEMCQRMIESSKGRPYEWTARFHAKQLGIDLPREKG